ncbi:MULTISPECIES: transporter substrate-binding domain-containing protein [Burkholderiaceae]|jgi:polar amino acid transport system substrate-binding protein|uniref:ABC-type amino acid transport/signal transduction system, periplasmic component/domain n=1 Tax=Caballeronia sordidicola TaxID=196367 RepID=A0A242M5L7_CABSO|nr:MULTISPECIES: transporter substrate-binding domain-containing protein [Burkholderiaceae]OTP66321.1 ABC-type amino acid transport/signal transduction system, periplasmic component/domain [Caballeronia sordidicola]
MKIRFSATFGIALSALALSLSAHADATLDRIKSRGTLIVGVVLDGTYGSLDPQTRKPVGYNVELAEDLARRLGVKFEAVEVTPPNRVQFLQQGKVDALIASMQYTKERDEILSYVPTPFEEIGGSAMVRKDSGIHNWSDLRGKPVCVSQGSNYTRPLIEQYGAQVKGFKGMPEALLALRGGSCVASVHVTPGIQARLANTSGEWKDYESPMPDQLIPSPSVIWVRKGETDTQAALDDIVKDWHKTGFLIDEGNKWHMPPSQQLLKWHQQYSSK